MFKELLKKGPYVRPSNEQTGSDLIICIDIGSTQTRAILRDREGFTSDVISVDTSYINIPGKLQNVATSAELSNNLEVIIEGGKIHSHIIKGDMRSLYNRTSRNLASSCSKLDQDATYSSILFMLGLCSLLYELRNNTTYITHNIKLVLSLPSEDVGSDARANKVIENLKGLFDITFPRFDNRTIKLDIGDITIHSEVAAAAVDYIISNSPSSQDSYVFLDCGGRNRGAILYHNGRIATESSITHSGGGENYMRELGQIIQNNYGINRPNNNSIIAALPTGVLKNGTTTVNITCEMDEAKTILAENLCDTVLALLDYNGLSITDISHIICSGRTMLPSIQNGVVTSPSVVSKLNELIQDMSPNTQCLKSENLDAIITGLYYLSMK